MEELESRERQITRVRCQIRDSKLIQAGGKGKGKHESMVMNKGKREGNERGK